MVWTKIDHTSGLDLVYKKTLYSWTLQAAAAIAIASGEQRTALGLG